MVRPPTDDCAGEISETLNTAQLIAATRRRSGGSSASVRPLVGCVELTDIVRRACDACIAEIRDGVPAVVPHEAAKRVIADAGLEHGRVHTSGYGLAPGFPPTWGEPIHMIGGSAYALRAGMVLSVEPPVFLGGEALGARIIDNVLVTANGAELLSSVSRDLIIVER